MARAEATLAQREETLWQMEELRRSSRVVKPTKRMEQYRLQQWLSQEGSDEDEGEQPWEEDDDESWEPRKENRDTLLTVVTTPEMEENANEGEYRILKDNQLWEKQDEAREESENRDNGEETQADGTMEKGLGPMDVLVQTGNPYEFQPYTMKILKTN